MIYTASFHTPVLLDQVMKCLQVERGAKYIDATLGGGGHTKKILALGGMVLGIDQDIDAIRFVEGTLLKEIDAKSLCLVKANFENIGEKARTYGFGSVRGILFDLGISSYQLDQSGRGISFMRNEPLDMRMDREKDLDAAHIVNKFSEDKLYELFTTYAEELHSRSIAHAIVRSRTVNGPINSTFELIRAIDDIVESSIGCSDQKKYEKNRNALLARIFQALRIGVNNELACFRKGLRQSIGLLERGGKLIVISYHSLEDRIVKNEMRWGKEQSLLCNLTKKPIRPEQDEIRRNSRSRSAKMRCAEKL